MQHGPTIAVALVAVVAVLTAGCATPDPRPAEPEVAATAVPGSPGEGTAANLPVPGSTSSAGPRPRRTGVTTDPGTRYLTTGLTGALAVETTPPAPEAVAQGSPDALPGTPPRADPVPGMPSTDDGSR